MVFTNHEIKVKELSRGDLILALKLSYNLIREQSVVCIYVTCVIHTTSWSNFIHHKPKF